MGFSSSHGSIHWSFGNYGIFVDNLHKQMTDEQIADFNTFQSYVFSEFGYPPEKCSSLADMLETIQPKLVEDDSGRCEQLIESLRVAHKENHNLRFR